MSIERNNYNSETSKTPTGYIRHNTPIIEKITHWNSPSDNKIAEVKRQNPEGYVMADFSQSNSADFPL